MLRFLRRYFSRRAARGVLAEHLPRGLRSVSLNLFARDPGALDAPPAEYWTLPLGLRPAKPLLRLHALPAPLVDAGVARPKNLRLDDELRLPPEIDPPRVAADAAPFVRERRVRPRTPLARAPLARLRPRHFRLDPRTAALANESILPLAPRDPTYRWLVPQFRRRFLDLPWMAQERIGFLGPTQSEWFTMWWDQTEQRRPGAKEPYHYVLSTELDFALDECKEQMLIRRDVKKDESPPAPEEFIAVQMGHPIAAHEREALSALLPRAEWVERWRASPALALALDRAPREAYLQWRTLLNALSER